MHFTAHDRGVPLPNALRFRDDVLQSDLAKAAEALRPIAGPLAFFVFALGIIGTGLLALPVLAGSSAYALGETFGWHVGLARKPRRAKAFYGAIAVATLLAFLVGYAVIAWFMRWLGKYDWPIIAAISLGMPIVTYLIFERWFLVPLPKGPLEDMLGL